jgi:hypothetical protein
MIAESVISRDGLVNCLFASRFSLMRCLSPKSAGPRIANSSIQEAVSADRPSGAALLDWDGVGHKGLGVNAIGYDSRYSRRQEAFVLIFRRSRLNKAPMALSCER